MIVFFTLDYFLGCVNLVIEPEHTIINIYYIGDIRVIYKVDVQLYEAPYGQVPECGLYLISGMYM